MNKYDINVLSNLVKYWELLKVKKIISVNHIHLNTHENS